MRLKKLTALLLAAAITITGIYIPVNPVNTYATEVELTDTDTTEASTAGDTYAYVRSARELISALNGTSVSGSSIKIQMKEPYSLLNDEDYTIADGDVNLTTGIVIPENTDLTLDMSVYDLTVSNNVVESADHYLKIVVPKSSSLTLTTSLDVGDSADLPFAIENKGTLLMKGFVMLFPAYGNGILNTGSATMEEFARINGYRFKEPSTSKEPIYNDGGTFVINSQGEMCSLIVNDPDQPKTSLITNKNGNMTIESVGIGKGIVSGNAILNDGKDAVLEIRGGLDQSTTVYATKGNAIMNNAGKVSIIEGTKKDGTAKINIYGGKIGILNYNGGSLDMYSGCVFGGNGSGCAAIATTPYIDSSLTGTLSEGSVNIVGGHVGIDGDDNIGIAYSGDALPVLLGGEVYGTAGAVAKYASNGTNGTVGTLASVEEFQFKNAKKEITKAYTPAKGAIPAQAMTSIINGLNPYASQTVSFDGIRVGTFTELQTALLTGGDIQLKNDITVTASLSFKDGTNLYGAGDRLIMNDNTVQLIIEKDAKVRFSSDSSMDDFITMNKTASGNAGIVNLGTLSMNQVRISDYTPASTTGRELIRNSGTLDVEDSVLNSKKGSTSANEPAITIHNQKDANAYIKGRSQVYNNGSTDPYGIAIYNEGNLELNTQNIGGNSIYTSTQNGSAIWNTGTTTMKGDTRVVSLEKDSIAVKNQGIFIMKSGFIGANKRTGENNHSYAIAYEGDKLPHLEGGRVEGSYLDKYTCTDDGSKGSAVTCVTDWSTLTTKMGSFINADGVTTSGLNSSLIINGIPNRDAKLESNYGYLLMEKGEVISDCVSKLFKEKYRYTVSNNVVITSTSANVLSVSQNAGKYVATAVGTGMSMLRMELKEAGISDYIRVEVVEDRAKLIGENFQGSILENNLLYNAYRSSVEIPVEWHLKDSYDVTSGDRELDLNNLVTPQEILLESQDPEFKKYFKDSDEITFHKDTKQYSFELVALTNSNEEYNYLVSSGIKGFSDIHAKLLVEVNGKTETIDMGTFDIMADYTEPKFEYSPITLNSAYESDAEYYDENHDAVYPNKADMTSYAKMNKNEEERIIVDFSYPNGFSATKGSFSSYYLSYTGTPKKGSYSIPIQVGSYKYNGYFESKIPVKVINENPKAEAYSKNIVVAKSTSDASDIPILIASQTPAGVSTVSSVEVVGKDSSFAVVNSKLNGKNNIFKYGKKYIHSSGEGLSFYLQPRKALTKPEKVTLKVTYSGVRGSGKESQMTVTIVPKDLKKASMKAMNQCYFVAEKKTNADGEKVRDYGTFYFTTTPSNYEGGHFVVTGLNGTGLDAGRVERDWDGSYYVTLYANDSITAGKKQFSICWYDKEGNMLGKPLKAKAIVQGKSELTIPDKHAVMDFNKAGQMTATVKYKASYDWGYLISLNPNFEVVRNVNNFTIYAKPSAINSGAVLPGKSYLVDIKISNSDGTFKAETLQVTVKDIKNIKVKAEDTVIYKNAPSEQYLLDINTSKPAYGMSIAKVRITDSTTPFEVRAVRNVGNYYYDEQTMINGQQSKWSIALKDNKYNSKLTGKQKVNLEITYQNGKTALTQMNVKVK